MPVIRAVPITPREAEQLREIRVNMELPGINPPYVAALRALLLRIEQRALGVLVSGTPDRRKPWERTDWTCTRASVGPDGLHCPDEKCADCPKRAAAAAAPSQAPNRPNPPLIGTWHHGQGHLVSGTIRISSWDCDTNPPVEFRDKLLDWICDTLNTAVKEWERTAPDEFADGVPELIGECWVPMRGEQADLDGIAWADEDCTDLATGWEWKRAQLVMGGPSK